MPVLPVLRLACAAALVAACSQPPKPTPVDPIVGSAAEHRPQAPIDAPAPDQEEKLAAIQKAMNELDEAAQGCWAMAATDRFDIEGELTVMIEISATSAKAQVVTDTARNGKLAACVVQLLGGYRWAPPLHGETIQLPFEFRAPDGQSVIDRKLVEWHGQSTLSVAVLVDENNTANPAASMFEIAIEAGGQTGWRKADRAELWYFLTPAGLVNPPTSKAEYREVATGDMMYVAAGQVRNVRALTSQAARAVVVVTPGGREGTARAGALPTPTAEPAKATPKRLAAADAKTFGPATIFLDGSVVKATPLAASILALPAGATLAEHVHANETELLYILEGSGTITVAGQDVAVTPTSVIQIPPNTKHAFAAATTAVRALQVYTPAGPEQRFKGPKK
jgi:quercetin dioxygenase-like cupin family protein